jgi:hypothetical protein
VTAIFWICAAIVAAKLFLVVLHALDRRKANAMDRERFKRTGKTREEIMDEARGNVWPT